MSEETLIERLLTENEEFRRLRHEHQHYDQELAGLVNVPAPTADRQVRIAELKKLKLRAKDRMEAIIRSARTGVTA